MSNAYTVKVNNSAKKVQSFQIENVGQAQGKGLHLVAQSGEKIQLVDNQTGFAPHKVLAKRIGQDLHVAFEQGDIVNPDLVIENYYSVDHVQLLGQTEAGNFADYVLDRPDAATTVQATGSEGTSAWYEPGIDPLDPGIMTASGAGAAGAAAGGILGAVAGVGVIAAVADDGSDDANAKPVAGDDTRIVAANEAGTIGGNVLGNDTDADKSAVLEVLSVAGHTVGTAFAGAYGSFKINADGSYTYDLDKANLAVQALTQTEHLTDTITYTVSDGQGGTDTATLTVTINGVNDAPVAVNDTAAVAANQAGNISGNVLGTDTDVDHGTTLTVSAVDGHTVGEEFTSTYGKFTVKADGSYTYDLDEANLAVQVLNKTGHLTDTITYTVRDEHGATDTATLTVTINGIETEAEANATININPDVAIVDLYAALLSNVSDASGIQAVDTTGTVGAVSFDPVNKILTYTPDADAQHALAEGETATDTFSYTTADGRTETVTLISKGVNDAPVAVNDLTAVAADETVNISGNVLTGGGGAVMMRSVRRVAAKAAGADTDVDNGAVLHVSAVEDHTVGTPFAGAYGTFTLNADGSYTYDLNEANSGVQALSQTGRLTDTITYTVSDQYGATDTATLTVNINGIDNAATLNVNEAGTTDDLHAALLANVAGATDIQSVNTTGTVGHVAFDEVKNTLTYTANAAAQDGLAVGETATDSFTYTTTDGQTETVTVTIDGVNDAPVAVDDTNTVVADQAGGISGTVLSNDTDVDHGTVLQVSAVDGHTVGTPFAGAYGSFTINTDGSYTYDLDETNSDVQALTQTEHLTETITYTVSDGHGGTDTATLTVTIDGVNDAPVATNDPAAVAANQAGNISGNVLSGTSFHSAPTLAVNTYINTSLETSEAGEDYADLFQVTLEAGKTYTILMNGSTSGQGTMGDPYLHLYNAAGQSIARDDDSGDDHGTGGNRDAYLTFAPTETGTYYIGAATYDDAQTGVTYRLSITDGGQLTDATATVTTEEVGIVKQGNGLIFGGGIDTDVDHGAELHVSEVNGNAVGTPVAGTYGTFKITADGSYIYDLDETNSALQVLNQTERLTDTITYTVSDGQGGVDTAALTVTINGVNDAPVAVDDTATVAANAADNISGNVLSGSDTDVDHGTTLTVSAVDGHTVGTPFAGTYGIFKINADGSYTYDLDETNTALQVLNTTEHVTDSITYTVSDGQGGVDTATLTVTINGANDDPVATNDTAAALANQASNIIGNVLLNDSDVDNATPPLQVAAVDGHTVGTPVAGAYGTFTIDADGSYSYDLDGANLDVRALNTAEHLTDSITYTVSDGQGGVATATLAVRINGVNDAPVAVDDTATVAADQADNINGNVLSGNPGADIDVDHGEVLQVLSVTGHSVGSVFNGTYGTFMIGSSGNYIYNLNEENSAVQALSKTGHLTDTATYTVMDSYIARDTATLTVTINGVDDAATLNVNEDGTTDDFHAALLANVVGATDIGSVNTTGTVGTVAFDASNKTLTYTADAAVQDALNEGQTATDTFTYTTTDGHTETVTVTIKGVNDAPVAGDDTNTVAADWAGDITGNVVTNDTDIDNATPELQVATVLGHTVGAEFTSSYGKFTVNADGTYTYNLNEANSAVQVLNTTGHLTDTITYTVKDQHGATDTATLAVTINGVDTAATLSVNEDGTTDDLHAALLSNVAGATDIVSVGTSGTVGTVAFDAVHNTLTYTANAAVQDALNVGDTATDSFTYTTSEGQTETVTVTINGVNDAPVVTGANAIVTAVKFDTTSGNVLNTLPVAPSLAMNTYIDTTLEASEAGTDFTDVFQVTLEAGKTYSIAMEGVDTSHGTMLDPYLHLYDAAGQVIKWNNDLWEDAGHEYDPNRNSLLTFTATESGTYYIGAADANYETDVSYRLSISDGTATLVAGASPTEETGIVVLGKREYSELTLGSFATDVDDAAGALVVSDVLVYDGGRMVSRDLGVPFKGQYGNLTMNADGSYTYVLDNANAEVKRLAQGTNDGENFKYIVSDGHGGTTTASLFVQINGVNDAPVAGDDTATVVANRADNISGNVLSGSTGKDTDVDINTVLTVSAVAGHTVGEEFTSTYGKFTVNADGSYTYNLDEANSAVQALKQTQHLTEDTIAYTVSDGKGGTDTATLTVTINGVNDAPVAVNDDAAVDANTANISGNVLDNDTDADSGAVIKVSAVAGHTVGEEFTSTYGKFTVNADGSYTYDLDATNSALQALKPIGHLTDTITYTVSDEHDATATATLTVTINGVDATLNVTENGTTDDLHAALLANVADATDIVSVDTTGTAGTVAFDAVNNTLTYTANAADQDALKEGETATDSFTYTTNDGHIETVTVTINGVNDATVAVADTATVAADQAGDISGNVLANDTDVDSSLQVSAVDGHTVGTVFNAAYGTFNIDANGSYTYNLDETNSAVQALKITEHLTDAITYTVSDGAGGVDTATLTVTINGIAASAPDYGMGVPEGLVSDNLHTLLIENVAGATDIQSVYTTNTVGTVAFDAINNTLTYAADAAVQNALKAGDTASDSFSYTTNDGHGHTSTALVYITTPGVNDAPVAVDDTNTVAANQAVAITGNVIIGNGFGTTGVDTDVDRDAILQVSSWEGSDDVTHSVGTEFASAYGNFTVHADGSYSYEVDASNSALLALVSGEELTDTLTYTVRDEHGLTDEATLTVTITGVNDAPMAGDDTNTVFAAATGNINGHVLSNDIDPDNGYALSVHAVDGFSERVGQPVVSTYGSFTIDADGSYTYDLNEGNAGVQALGMGDILTDVIGYRVADQYSSTDEATLTVTIIGVNDAPVAVNDTATLVKTLHDNNYLSANVLLNDTDVDHGDLLVVQSANGSGVNGPTPFTTTYGTIVISPDGSYSYAVDDENNTVVIDAFNNGTKLYDVIPYSVVDQYGFSDQATLTITIDGHI